MCNEPFPGQALLQWLQALVPLEAWMPEQQRDYAPLVRDGLAFFLATLPAARLEAMVKAQAALADAAPAERLTALMRQCPVLHKLGQTLAHDPRLAPELRRSLTLLETLPPTLGIDAARREIATALPALSAVSLDAPIAEASVAAVVPFRHGTRDGVFKLLKPGIEQRLAEDLAHWSELGDFLARRAACYGLPPLEYRATLESAAALVRAELRLDLEQKNMALARRLYAGSPHVKVPRLYPDACSRRITAMERIHGTPLGALEAGTRSARDTAHHLLAGLFVEPLLDTGHESLVHGDPHPGNMLLTADGRLAVFDWALAARLRPGLRRQLTRIAAGACLMDTAAVADSVSALANGACERPALDRVAANAVRRLRRGAGLTARWLIDLLDDAAIKAHTRFPQPMLVLRKSLQMAFGLFDELAPGDDAARALTRNMLERLGEGLGTGRLPATGMQPADWREMAWRASWLPGRLWLDLLGDWMDRIAPDER